MKMISLLAMTYSCFLGGENSNCPYKILKESSKHKKSLLKITKIIIPPSFFLLELTGVNWSVLNFPPSCEILPLKLIPRYSQFPPVVPD